MYKEEQTTAVFDFARIKLILKMRQILRAS